MQEFRNDHLSRERAFIFILPFPLTLWLFFCSGVRGERKQSAGPRDVSAAELRHAGRDGASVAAIPIPPAAQHAPRWRRLRLGGQQLSRRQQHGLLRPGPEWVTHMEHKNTCGGDDDDNGGWPSWLITDQQLIKSQFS